MNLGGGGSSLWQGYLTRDNYFKLTTLKRECKGDQRHSSEAFFFFLGEKKGIHSSYAVRPFELLQSGLHSQVWCPWYTASHLPPRSSWGKGPEQRHVFGIRERVLNILKWLFHHLKPWQVDDLASPLSSLPFSRWFLITLPRLSLPSTDGSSEVVKLRRET